MRFLVDESADARLAPLLAATGHDVTSIVRDYPRSLPDRGVLAIALQQQRVVITNDRDFGELVVRQGLPHAGVILLRLTSVELSVVSDRLRQVLNEHPTHLHRLVVVTDRRVRIR